MSDKEQISSPCAMHRNATVHYDYRATEGQSGMPDSMSPSSLAYTKNDVKPVIEFLDVCRQRPNVNVNAMKELYHRRQNMMMEPSVENSATLLMAEGGASLPFTGLGFHGSNFQYHQSQGLGMDTLHHDDIHDAVGPFVSMQVAGRCQTWAALSHNTQISTAAIGDESFPCRAVARYHDKRTFTPTHRTSLQSTDLDCGYALEIDFGSARSCLPGQTLSPSPRAYIYDDRDGYARSSVSAQPRKEIRGPSVLSFMSDGIKHYRCECGYESTRKGDVDHHLESLKHSKRKYECSCGKKFTRNDSLNRHRKRCRN